jgi:hypothetical protein
MTGMALVQIQRFNGHRSEGHLKNDNHPEPGWLIDTVVTGNASHEPIVHSHRVARHAHSRQSDEVAFTAMEPFTIAVPDAVLDDLRERLGRTRVPNQLPDIGWEQGTERNYLVELQTYWREGYDWRKAESRLNSYPQYLTHFDGTRIHLLHARSANPNAVPLLITHGWPGSILEFLDVIELLNDDFHIVTPSLPGFTFSGETTQRGLAPTPDRGRVGRTHG